jgi:hypothetical protein
LQPHAGGQISRFCAICYLSGTRYRTHLPLPGAAVAATGRHAGDSARR